MTMVTTALYGLKHDITAYLRELLSLLPAAARFVWLVLMGAVAIIATPIYGAFIFSAYLWSEAGWSEKLSRPQKILFWSIVLPLAAAQWYLAVSAMHYLRLI